MGMMIDGKWQRDDLRSAGASFVRPQTVFRNWVTADGSPGPSGEGGFKAQRGRYHLYVSLACPWAHRTLIVRQLKKLDDAITVSVVDPFMGDDGWAFEAPDGSSHAGRRATTSTARATCMRFTRLARTDYTGRVTVPVLWDRETRTIVNNESSEIIRMLNSRIRRAGRGAATTSIRRRGARRSTNSTPSSTIRSTMASTSAASPNRRRPMRAAFDPLFETLDRLERRLASRRYLLGARTTRPTGVCFPR